VYSSSFQLGLKTIKVYNFGLIVTGTSCKLAPNGAFYQLVINKFRVIVMLIFDMFFWQVYKFLHTKIKRCEEDAKHSALSFIVVYIGFLAVALLCILGIIYDNVFSLWAVKNVNNSFFISIIASLFSYIIFRIRYYRIYDVEQIAKRLYNLPKFKYTVLKYLTIGIVIGAPIIVFVTFRLYAFGHIRWW
jgi:hypothetical protein